MYPKSVECKNQPLPKNPSKKHATNAQIIHFTNHAEFLLWKDAEEQRTVSKYARSFGEWNTKTGKSIKFTCHRGGKARVKPQECRKRMIVKLMIVAQRTYSIQNGLTEGLKFSTILRTAIKRLRWNIYPLSRLIKTELLINSKEVF